MLLIDLFEGRKHKDGSYVAVQFSKKSVNRLYSFAESLKISNLLPKDEYHVTVIYSTKPLPKNFKAKGTFDPTILAQPKKLSLFKTQTKKSNVLVLELTCPELAKRHKQLMDEYDLVSDFPRYKAHISFSYNVGDFEINKDIDLSVLKDLEIIKEYHESLK